MKRKQSYDGKWRGGVLTDENTVGKKKTTVNFIQTEFRITLLFFKCLKILSFNLTHCHGTIFKIITKTLKITVNNKVM